MPIKDQSKQRVDWQQVCAFRLARHHLADHSRADAASLCRDACGIQAQVLSAACLALWARNHSLTRTAMDAALRRERTLVKTSAMRGTLHLLAADDFSIYMRVLRESRVREMQRIMARSGVTAREANDVRDAAVEALAAGPATRRELTAPVLSRVKVSAKARKWFEQSWWGVTRQAIVEGLVCYGPDRGGDVTLVRVEQWLPRQKRIAERAAQQELLRRYLRAFGPATLRDFARWAGLPAPEAAAIWKSLGDELVEVAYGEQSGSLLKKDWKQLTTASLREPSLRLLPAFDTYLLGHSGKDHLVEPHFYKRVFRNAGWISPGVLLNGRVAGTWSHALKEKRLRVEVAPFAKFSPAIRKRVEEEAAALGAFLELPCEIHLL